MLYGCPDVLWYIRTAIQHLFHLSCFFPVFMRSVFLCGAQSCPVLGQGALGQEALLWFLQSPGIPYVISL